VIYEKLAEDNPSFADAQRDLNCRLAKMAPDY